MKVAYVGECWNVFRWNKDSSGVGTRQQSCGSLANGSHTQEHVGDLRIEGPELLCTSSSPAPNVHGSTIKLDPLSFEIRAAVLAKADRATTLNEACSTVIPSREQKVEKREEIASRARRVVSHSEACIKVDVRSSSSTSLMVSSLTASSEIIRLDVVGETNCGLLARRPASELTVLTVVSKWLLLTDDESAARSFVNIKAAPRCSSLSSTKVTRPSFPTFLLELSRAFATSSPFSWAEES